MLEAEDSNPDWISYLAGGYKDSAYIILLYLCWAILTASHYRTTLIFPVLP